MKLQGEYNIQDFMDLYFNKHYFNSKQNFAAKCLILISSFLLVFETFLFIFVNSFFLKVNSFLPFFLVLFLFVVFVTLYFFLPKIQYYDYKRTRKPDAYIELDEHELKLHANKELKIEMGRLKNSATLKNGYFLDFDETLILYIPKRFFKSREDLMMFQNLCNRFKLDDV